MVPLPSSLRAEMTSNEAQGSPTHPSLLTIACPKDAQSKFAAQWGLTRALSANAVKGVSEGFNVSIKLVGVGYRGNVEEAQATSPQDSKRQTLVLRLGYPLPVRLEVPVGMTCTVEQPTELVLRGSDLQSLTSFAASIRRLRKPEPYNGKGIFVNNEKIKRKEVKKK